MMNAIKTVLLSSLAMSCAYSAQASDDQLFGGTISGKVTLATDYVFRGESETIDAEEPVAQATLGWGNDQGWYTGVFASNAKFRNSDIRMVNAPYIGKYGKFGDSGFTYDVMLFAYLYPGSTQSNYTELWMKVGKQFGKTNIQLEVTPTLDDWFGVKGWDGINYSIHPSYAISDSLAVSGSVGYQDLSGEGAEGWTHWNLGLGYKIKGLNFDLRYHGSSVKKDHKVYGSQTDIFDNRIVFGLSKTF